MGLLTTIALAITATTASGTGESEIDPSLSFNHGEKYYVGAEGADETTSWYIKPSVGWNYINDVSFSVGLDLVSVEFDSDTAFNIGIGFHINNNLRLEFGYTDTDNDIETLRINGTAFNLAAVGVQANLEQETISGMLFYDFDTDGGWNPYVGVGIGNMDGTLNVTVPAFGLGLVTTGSETAFMFAAGINWEITHNLDIFAEWRAMSWDDDLAGDIRNNAILVGLSWRF